MHSHLFNLSQMGVAIWSLLVILRITPPSAHSKAFRANVYERTEFLCFLNPFFPWLQLPYASRSVELRRRPAPTQPKFKSCLFCRVCRSMNGHHSIKKYRYIIFYCWMRSLFLFLRIACTRHKIILKIRIKKCDVFHKNNPIPTVLQWGLERNLLNTPINKMGVTVSDPWRN